MKKTLLAACIASTVSTGAIADDYPDFEAYIGGARYFFDGDRNLDDANSLEVGAEIPMTEALSLEAWLSSFDAEVENGSAELDGMRYSAGGLYHFSNDDLRPFASLGLSHQEFETEANDEHDEALVYLGAGVKKYFDNNLILRAELLGLNSIDHETTDLAARVAVGYAFGRTYSSTSDSSNTYVQEEKPVVAEETKAQAAQDAPMEKVAEVTEPAKKAAPEAQTKPEVKPVPAPVAKPVDSDNDGVVDSKDKCANTNAAFVVDEMGCPKMLSETLTIKMNVKFPTNSATVTQDNLAEIKKVADFMKQFDKTSVTVEGHSDDRGRDAYNKTLSQKRADAVRQTLIETFAVESSRVKAIGYGEERPIADNATAEGRATNRRVVAIVESTVQKPAVK